jgi:hypothetical protein
MAFARLKLWRVEKKLKTHAEKAEVHKTIYDELSTMAKMVDAAETARLDEKLKKAELAESYRALFKHFKDVKSNFSSKKQFVDRTLQEYLKNDVEPYIGPLEETPIKTLQEYLSGDLSRLDGLKKSLETLVQKHAGIYAENSGKAAELEEKIKQLQKKAMLASINKRLLKR